MKNYFLMAAAALMTFSTASAQDYEPDVVFNTIAEVGNNNFSIVNITSGTAIYGSGAQNVGIGSYTDAGKGTIPSFRLERIEGNKYLLKAVTQSGGDYSLWGDNPCYLNAQPNVGGVTFILGLAGQNGKDMADGAVWAIDEVTGGFTLQCVGNNGYFNGTATSADPSVWQFCTLKEKPLEYNVGDDITELTLKNPSFDTNDLSAWTFANDTKPTVDGTHHNCEFYQATFDMKQTIKGLKKGTYEIGMQAFQRPGAPNDALANAYTDGTWTSCATLYTTAMETAVPHACSEMQETPLFGNGSGWPYDSQVAGMWIPNSMEGAKIWFEAGHYKTTAKAVVTEDGGSLTFGFKGQEPTQGWILFDNFTLKYISEAVMVDAAESDKLLAKVPTGKMGNNAKEALDAAVDGIQADKTDGNLYNALKDAIAAAEASIAYYATIAPWIETYNGLDEAGKASVQDPAANFIAAYEVGSMDELSYPDAQAVVNEYIAPAVQNAVKAQAPVADMTILASAKWTNQNGNVDWAMQEEAYKGIPERYQEGAFTGDVMTQTITGLQKGTYRVTMVGGASYTSGRGFEGATGQNHAYFFANDALQSMEVYDRTEIAAGTLDEAVLECGVNEDGILKFGIQNITIGANWFVINLEKIEYISTDLPPVDVDMVIGDSKWATFIAPFEVTVPAGVTAYTVNGFEQQYADGTAILEMTAVTTIPANTPVVLNAESAVNETVSGVSLAEGLYYTAGLLTGVYGDLEITEGYVLQNQEEMGIGFYAVSADNRKTIPANHAYLNTSAAGVKAFLFGGNTTGIQALESLTAGKAQIYDLNGRQLQKLQKGVNIVNGVKVLVK